MEDNQTHSIFSSWLNILVLNTMA